MTGSPHHGWLYRQAIFPFLGLLRMGTTPKRLAWSIAAGLVIGINPLLGSTTLLCLGVASLFRLNIAASQIANHLMYPVEVLLVIPFIRLGSHLFHTAPLPLTPARLLREVRVHPLDVTRQLWLWESHALAVWAIAGTVLTPLIAATLTPVLRRVLLRMRQPQDPIAPTL